MVVSSMTPPFEIQPVGGDGAGKQHLRNLKEPRRLQVIDHLRFELFHRIQDVAEICEIASHQFYLVCHVLQPPCVAAHMEHNRSLLSPLEQQTHYLCTDKARTAGNQCSHTMPSLIQIANRPKMRSYALRAQAPAIKKRGTRTSPAPLPTSSTFMPGTMPTCSKRCLVEGYNSCPSFCKRSSSRAGWPI